MNIAEYSKRLNELSDDELKNFNSAFGGGQKTRDERVRGYVDYPEHERRICQLLGLKTEDEKLVEAALNSAEASVQSARSARLSIIWAAIACLISIVSVIVAVISVVIS